MAIASILCAAMNNNNNKNIHQEAALDGVDEEEQDLSDMVMPGFRFHPTEEELVEFYLRRKVEGKRFNVELITFLDLYRYDPWELPALAAIGEKEWYFYVPRDRKYRNGDRPNRVTTSGYWKATGADRMIRSENLRSIGLKKTLVFYSGKAPKGIRTSWIMNEYRLPLHETERLQKVEISLCRVYKRAGVEDHPCLPRSLPTTRASSSSSSLSKATQPTRDNNNHSKPANNRANMVNFQARYGKSPQQNDGTKLGETSPTSNSTDIISNPSFPMSKHNPSYTISPLLPLVSSSTALDDHDQLLQPKQHAPNSMNASSIQHPSFHQHAMNDDLQKLVNINNSHSASNNLDHQNPHHEYLGNVVPNLLSHFHTNLQHKPPPESGPVALNVVPGAFQAAFTDRLWEWNGAAEGSKDFTNLFK